MIKKKIKVEMCANNHENTLIYGSIESNLINSNNLNYNNESCATRTETKKLMRGVIKSLISYVKQSYYFYNYLNNLFLSSNLYK